MPSIISRTVTSSVSLHPRGRNLRVPCTSPDIASGGGVLNDTDYYARYIDLEKWLSSEPERYELG